LEEGDVGWRTAIRGGTFRRRADVVTAAPAVTADGTTFEKFAATFVERVSQVRERNKSWKADESHFAQIAAFTLTDGSRLGDKPLGAVTEDDLEAFMAGLRSKGYAASTRNHYVQLLQASCRWATKKGYLARNPISEDSTLRRAKIAKRHRRLMPDVLDMDGKVVEPGEERRLLAAASPRLQNLIIAALETACRCGELLSLQWRDVDLERGELTIRAEKAKDGDTRVLPISSRLRVVLTMAQTDPAGTDYPVEAFVFGELGQETGNISRAWRTCVLKAYGHDPRWTATAALVSASLAALRVIDLHFHDLRHEGASRLLEAGWPLHHVQEMLGHSSIDQTTTYLNVVAAGLRASMAKSDAARCKPVASEAGIDLKLPRNETAEVTEKPTVN